MGKDLEKAATYIEFSVHHLEIAGLLPSGPDLEQFQAHPLHAKLAADWLAQDDSDVAAVGLLHLEERLFSRWDEDRRVWIEAYLPACGLPSEVCAKGIEVVEAADKKLSAGIARSRGRKPVEQATVIPKRGSIPWPKPEQAKKLATLFSRMAGEEAPAEFEQARRDAGISREQALAAADALGKLAATRPRRSDPPEQPRKATVSQSWQKLWENPSHQAMSVLETGAVMLHDLFVAHLLSDDELCATPQYQELVVRVNVPVGASPERYREKTLATLRGGPTEVLPISTSVTSEVATVLNSYFANWRLALDPETIASIVQSQRGGP